MTVIGRRADRSGFSRNPKPPALAGGDIHNQSLRLSSATTGHLSLNQKRWHEGRHQHMITRDKTVYENTAGKNPAGAGSCGWSSNFSRALSSIQEMHGRITRKLKPLLQYKLLPLKSCSGLPQQSIKLVARIILYDISKRKTLRKQI